MARLDFSAALELLSGARRVVVCGHVNPDGDALGSVLGMTHVLRALGYDVTPLLATSERPRLYDFLEGYDELLHAAKYKGAPDVFVSVDVPSIQRTGDAVRVFDCAAKSIAIDHHQGKADFADVSIVDEHAAAAGMLVWDFAEAAGVGRDARLATCCYTALVTDTGRFQFQNTDARALEAAASMARAGACPADISSAVYQRSTMAALQLKSLAIKRMEFVAGGNAVISYVTQDDFESLGATPDDGESLIDAVRQVDGIEVAVMLREHPPTIRGSIRSKTDRDVACIAAQMGGGGHAAAAGFTLREGLEEARSRVISLLEGEFARSEGEKTR